MVDLCATGILVGNPSTRDPVFDAVFGAGPVKSGAIAVDAGLVRPVDAPDPGTSVDVRVVSGAERRDCAPGATVESGFVGPVVDTGTGLVVTVVVGAVTEVVAAPGSMEKLIAAASTNTAATSPATIARRGVIQRGGLVGVIRDLGSRHSRDRPQTSSGRRRAHRRHREVPLHSCRPSQYGEPVCQRRARNRRHPS